MGDLVKRSWLFGSQTWIAKTAPGVLLACLVAATAIQIQPWIAKIFPAPAMIVALAIGCILYPSSQLPYFNTGIVFCVKTILRFAVALLGFRIALAEIVSLGIATILIVMISMAVTIAAGILLAKYFGLREEFGALAGAGTAVCGASATLATASVVRDYPGKEADVIFVVIAMNVLSTIAMLVYPILFARLEPHIIGIALGGTIHDVAQAAAAGYLFSNEVGNTTIIVKLFRVFLLFPVVLCIGLWISRLKAPIPSNKIPIPGFAFAFLAFCVVNTMVPSVPVAAPLYSFIRPIIDQLASAGLLIALAALGLSTSLSAFTTFGWRQISIVCMTTVVILASFFAGLAMVGF